MASDLPPPPSVPAGVVAEWVVSKLTVFDTGIAALGSRPPAIEAATAASPAVAGSAMVV